MRIRLIKKQPATLKILLPASAVVGAEHTAGWPAGFNGDTLIVK